MPLIKQKSNPAKKFFGSSGTEVSGGVFYEDYLTDLNGQQAIDTYERMRRGDGQIKKVLSAMKNPIRSAKYIHEPKKAKGAEEATDEDVKIADFLNWNWFENPFIDFDQFLNETLTFLDFGYSLHEYVFTFYDHPEFGPIHILGGLGFRKQSSIYRWFFDENKTGRLTGVEQIATGDTSTDRTNVTIPVEYLLINTNDQEGDNYEGISMLRASYGAWRRKNTYLKLTAVGVEKAAIGTPIGKYPQAMENEGDKQEFIDALGNLATNDQSFIAMPEGFEIEIMKIDFDADKINTAIVYEDQQIAGSALLSFLELGMNGNGGSYSLGEDLSDIALESQKYVGRQVTKKMLRINRELVAMNFGDPNKASQPRMIGIDKKAGKEFAEVVTGFVDKGVIRPDDTLETHIREKLDLPEAETSREDDIEELETPPNPRNPNPPSEPGKTKANPSKPGSKPPSEKTEDPAEKGEKRFNEDGIGTFRDLTVFEQPLNLSETAAEFGSAATRLESLMKKNLMGISAFALKDFKNRLKNKSDGATRADVALKTNLNVDGYERKLREAMSGIVNTGIKQARRDLKAKDKKLDLADDAKTAFEFLPEHVQAALKVQAAQQAKTHADEIQKIIAFGAVAAEDAQLTDAQMIKELEGNLGDYVESNKISSAARTVAAQNINRGRNDGFFFREENLKGIQAFQYSAIIDDRTTDICLSLDGQVFKMGSGSSMRFRPPNHHGCRSILIPITLNETLPDNVVELRPRTDNPSLVDEAKKRGKPVPSASQIEKSRNLNEMFYTVNL